MTKYIIDKLMLGIRIFWLMKWRVKIFLVLLAVGMFMFVAIALTGTSTFCNCCHIMNPYHDNWQTSSHKDVTCIACHLKPGLIGYASGKINGLAQAVSCIVGRTGTKPNAMVVDASCLRPECHNTEKLTSESMVYKDKIKFTHKNHIARVVDGIQVSCGTCHSHFEGDEHFEVNKKVCFPCHFLYNEQTDVKVAQTGCLDCHEVPNKVIKRGLVTIDHSEFAFYKASCDDSCHKRQIKKTSIVADTVCLNCHSFDKSHEPDSVKLHADHTGKEKVECFVCHGDVSHKPAESASVSSMMDCKNCHGDTHGVQQSIYTANYHTEQKDDKRILSPMFLTHVECTGCHIEQIKTSSGVLDSFGKVAKSVPQACDKCHQVGTGEKYIPFWQEKIKSLFNKVSDRLSELQNRARFETDGKAAEKLHENIRQAKALLDSVEADGSWGVHNLKYTEAMLMKANKIITEAQ